MLLFVWVEKVILKCLCSRPYNGSEWSPETFGFQHSSKHPLCSAEKMIYKFATTWQNFGLTITLMCWSFYVCIQLTHLIIISILLPVRIQFDGNLFSVTQRHKSNGWSSYGPLRALLFPFTAVLTRACCPESSHLSTSWPSVPLKPLVFLGYVTSRHRSKGLITLTSTTRRSTHLTNQREQLVQREERHCMRYFLSLFLICSSLYSTYAAWT